VGEGACYTVVVPLVEADWWPKEGREMAERKWKSWRWNVIFRTNL